MNAYDRYKSTPRQRLMKACDVCRGSGTDPAFLDECVKCSGTGLVATALTTPVPARQATGAPATEKQIAFAKKLLAERPNALDVLNGNLYERAFDLGSDKFIGKAEASALIDALLAIPPAPKPAPARTARPAAAPKTDPARSIPDGRYALAPEGEDGQIKYYKVTQGHTITFLDAFASDNTWPIKNRDAKAAILAEIAADPEAASLRFGRHTHHCGRCGRRLTDKTSQDRGIGPDCAEKGW